MVLSMSRRFGIEPYSESELSRGITSQEVDQNFDVFVDILKNGIEEIRNWADSMSTICEVTWKFHNQDYRLSDDNEDMVLPGV